MRRSRRSKSRNPLTAFTDSLRRISIAGVRHAVLGASGCGAFRNPATQVTQIHREEIDARRSHFDVIAFAIFLSSYGLDNYGPFAEVFDF